jgi:hypothetical protein
MPWDAIADLVDAMRGLVDATAAPLATIGGFGGSCAAGRRRARSLDLAALLRRC